MFSRLKTFSILLGMVVVCLAVSATANASVTPRSQAEEIRHQVIMGAYYGSFDWIDAEIVTNNIVVLHGQVRLPAAKTDAEARVRRIDGVAKVVNEIEVLPVSQNDDQIRIAMYRALFRYDSPLFRYSNPVVSSIHIVVNNGRVSLKGIVGDGMDRQLATVAARTVSGVFEVNNELTLDKS